VEVCRAAFHFACMNSSQHQLERHLTLAPSLHLWISPCSSGKTNE